MTGWRSLWVPDFVCDDLRLAQRGQVVAHGLLGIKAQVFRIGTNESFIEDAAGEVLEVLFFNSAEHACVDLGDVGDVVEREFFLLAGLAKLFSEFAHGSVAPEMGTS